MRNLLICVRGGGLERRPLPFAVLIGRCAEALAPQLAAPVHRIDRGQLAGSRIVMFERVGPKILLVAPNYNYRATSTNAAEVQSVKDAFARSVLWSFPVAAESAGRVLIDMTPFLARDNLNLAPRLRPGTYRLDESRSTIYMPGTFNLPVQIAAMP